MKLLFDFGEVDVVEFGVGKENGGGQSFVAMAVDDDVQEALREMAETTWGEMEHQTKSPEKYDPSEKHSGIEYLYLPLSDDMAEPLRQLHESDNLPLDGNALKTTDDVFCYFAQLTDTSGQQITALKRAGQFKGALKSRFVRLATDALKMVHDRVFRLDHDFDVLIDAKHIHILRPSSFEFAGSLQSAILNAVPANVAEIVAELPFVDFTGIKVYAERHPRAARLLASIRSQNQGTGVDKAALKQLCKSTQVVFTEKKGQIVVDNANVLGLLEVLDRRRYEVELVRGTPERFRASSRQKLANGSNHRQQKTPARPA
jgi:hypothetical protein